MIRVAHSLEEVEALGGYSLLYVDFPWEYRNGGRGAAKNHYETLPTVETLPVARLAAKDAVIFSWTTWPFLVDGVFALKAWGFEYKTCGFVWVKHHEGSGKKCVGGGFWTRANTEFCLIGVRGKNYPRRVDLAVRQLIETGPSEILQAPRGEHSAKPAEARARIVTLMGDVPRIELFARDRVEGWDAWGNDPKLGGSDVDLALDRAAEQQVG